VQFPEGVPGTNVHVVITGNPEAVRQFYDRQVWVSELTELQGCTPNIAPNGEVFCDFWVADGFESVFAVNSVETLDMSPPHYPVYQLGGPVGCSRVDQPTPDDKLVKCIRTIQGETRIEIFLEELQIGF
jgi:hypothetical protein